MPRDPSPLGVIGHNAASIGWPWVEETHSWLEPTALAVLALCREGLADHPRVKSGVDLILDRALKGGGWNYGNSSVFGRDLRPQPGPTGLALLALKARGEDPHEAEAAVDYLRSTLPGLKAGVSLGWGILGLRAHGACPREAESWLAECYRLSTGKRDAALSIAPALLGQSASGVGLFLPAKPFAVATSERQVSRGPGAGSTSI